MLNILIVDDDPSLRTLLTMMVTKLGYSCREATNGIQAEKLALEWEPDVILMDVMMPFQDGHVTCANLRNKGYSGHVILMSALSTGVGTTEVRKYGADTFLAKPISFALLQQTLEVCSQIPTLHYSPLTL